ncbi:aldehyde dehydrogenase family protein [Nonomuraea sp. G32]|nr:aldehyde dehydrogenase family protein [Nonomuraea sp. G32]MDP4503158.1 aldehyde dehydrogenase family protein [Nonomuraea sp. G32]
MTVVSAGRAEAEAAVAAARTAFDTTDWPRNASLRARALNELADRLAERVPAMGRALAQENGKLLQQTTWEVSLSVDWLRYSAASALTQIAGRAGEPQPGVHFHSTPEAMGVAGIIAPWNSPVILLVRDLGPAIGAGCTAVVKPPGQTGLTNALFAEAVAATTYLKHLAHRHSDEIGLLLVDKFVSFDITDDPDPRSPNCTGVVTKRTRPSPSSCPT